MPMHRTNKAPWRSKYVRSDQPWFDANIRRQRRREQLARAMRQIQRRRAKGK